VSAQPQLYKIHYADGRVDGPISSLVVRDLIKAGVIGDADLLSLGDETPKPYGAFDDFADLGAGAAPPPPRARSVSKTGVRVPKRKGTAPTPSRSGASRPVPRVSAATPTSGAHQLSRQAPSGAPPVPSAPPPPTTRSRTKENKFSEEWLNEGSEKLRDRLLMATLPDILGVEMADMGESVSRSYVARAAQIGSVFSGATETEERLAVADVLNILLRAQEVLTNATQRTGYEEANKAAGKVLSFQNHCMDFRFATEDSLGAAPARSTTNSSPGIRAARPSNPNLKARLASAGSQPSIPVDGPSASASTSKRRSLLSSSEKPPSLPVPSRSAPQRQVSGLPTISASAPENEVPGLPSIPDGLRPTEPSNPSIAPSLDGLFSPDNAEDWGAGAEDLFSQADDAPTTVGPPPIDPMGFPPTMLALGPEGLRDKLLMAALPEVLGVGLDATPDTLTHAYVARTEMAKALKASTSDKEHQLAALDVRNILLETHALLSDDARRQAYTEASETAGRMLSFQNHIPFSFATEVAIAIANADEATPRAPASFSKPSAPVSLLSSPSRKGRLQEAPAEAVKYKSKDDMDAERKRQEAAAKRREKKAKRRSEFGSQFKGAEHSEQGDPYKGKLAFGVGKTVRGLQQVGVGFALVFVASFGLVSFGGFGVKELSLEPTDQMLFIRAGIMALVAIGAVFIVRRENPLRLGWLPRWGVIIAIPAALGLAFVAGTIARFEISANNTDLYGQLAILLAIRAVGEGLFFHGFITRTLLIEFKNPGAAVFLSAVLYGLYGATYATLVQGGAFGAIYACFIYAFGGGFPFALMYWKTRSTPALILVHWIVLMGSAAGGVAYATKFAS
jgi:membrane protease YdiL (CAAX protease family)